VDTWQPVGSVSKTIIALLLAQAAARGVVAPDAPIAPHLGWQPRLPARPRQALGD